MAKTKARKKKQGRPFETLRALLIAVALALGIRAFVVEPFKIPSGSMVPTLLVGDYIIVNKFAFGIREPFSGKLLFPVGEPRRGDVIVFRKPGEENVDYIKRIVGAPGDRIEVRDGRLFVNQQPIDRVPDGTFSYACRHGSPQPMRRFREIAENAREYTVIYNPVPRTGSFPEIEVPEGSYFMMGDNRDCSHDSRGWNERHRFVTDQHIKGRAMVIHWSWDLGGDTSPQRGFVSDFLHTLAKVVTFQVEEIRWHRIGRNVDGLAD